MCCQRILENLLASGLCTTGMPQVLVKTVCVFKEFCYYAGLRTPSQLTTGHESKTGTRTLMVSSSNNTLKRIIASPSKEEPLMTHQGL